MAAFTFDAAYFSLIVFLSALVPGIAVCWPLFRKSPLGAMEKLLLSFFIGLFAVPFMLFIESLVGIKFSLFLVFANAFVLVAAGAFWGVREGVFLLSAPKLPKLDADGITALSVPALLLLAMLLAFWIRVQPYSPIYSELDPYFYVYGTGQIIQSGMQPFTDDTAWWPELNSTHLGQPLKKYLEAEWYALYTGGGEYNNYLLFTTSSWLPPISAAFVSFGAYMLVASMYGRRYGLLAAFLLAFLPITIYKMSAGVNEASPIGMMTLFMSLGAFAYALTKHDRALMAFSGIAFMATMLAGNYFTVLALPFAALMALQSIDYFLRGKPNREFVVACGYSMAGVVIGIALSAAYYGNPSWFASSQLVMPAAAFLFSAAVFVLLSPSSMPKHFPSVNAIHSLGLEGNSGKMSPHGDNSQSPSATDASKPAGLKEAIHAMGLERNHGKRMKLAAACAILALLLFAFTPFGGYAKSQVSGYLGAVEFKTALERTIAEQNLAGESFEGEAGFLAIVPQNHVSAGASGIGAIQSFIYGMLSVVAAVFSLIGNLSFNLLDAIFSAALGIQQSTSTKEDSLFFFFFIVSVAGLLLRHFRRSDPEREEPSVMLFALAFFVPVLYVGVNKIKFTAFAGVAIALAAAIAMAELERFFAWLAGRFKAKGAVKYVSVAFAFLLVLMVYAQAAGPVPYGYVFLIKSFEPRYQDDPVKVAPAASELCEALRAKGVPYSQIKPLCDAGAYANYSNSLNNQFNSEVCWLAQMKIDELFPRQADPDAQRRSSEAATSARFRCNRLADYWVDSMEWINANLDGSDRVTSWWDYGHWTNYFGERKTVLRNEHSSRGMIGRVAHDYIIGSTQDLVDSMNYFDSRYALFDVELIGGSQFGGKYGALDYLGCVHEGATSLEEGAGTSDCEYEHSPERIAIPRRQTESTACTISESQQRTGVYAYRLGKEAIDQTKPAYCIGEATLANGEKVSATYYLDRKDGNGDLALSKGFIRVLDDQNDVAYAEMVYNNQKVWPGQNGTLVDGMEDAKTGFYRSNLYKAFYLQDLPGFDLAYQSKNGEVKIYRMQNFTGNKERYIDPVESQRQS
jgi:asparagine N-glycosylation enzyme membrane subunit Stt3